MARRRDQWDHTANLLAAIENQFNSGRQVLAIDRHPLRKPEPPKWEDLEQVPVGVLADALCRIR